MNTTGLALAIVLMSGGISHAGDYFIYRDADGRTWLSNQDPRKKDDTSGRRQEDVKIIRQYQWQDLADRPLAGSTIVQQPPGKAPQAGNRR
jgi:hypothetical protein